MMDKKAIANLLEEMAFLLEFHSDNPFKIRAFQNAARAIASAPESLDALLETPGRLEQVKGIGKSIAPIIREYVATGRCQERDELRAKAPRGFDDLIKVPGLGPKKLRALVDQLGVETLDDLERVCRTGEAAQLAGFGQKTVENLLAGITQVRKFSGQWLFPQAWGCAMEIVEALRPLQAVRRIEIAGSLRRRKEIIRDIDILVASDEPDAVTDAFVGHALVDSVIVRGETKTSVRLQNGIQADLRVVTEEAFPSALQYFTGSKEHNTSLRGRARKLGFKLNEYGLFREESAKEEASQKPVRLREEADIYEALGLAFIPPELREDSGEIEAAEKGLLPKLVELRNYRGTLHCHTNWSDGAATLEEMVRHARETWKLSYLGICDHSQSAYYANGLDPKRLEEQRRAIDELNKGSRFRVLAGTESDILPDGSLDFPDEVLAALDVVVVSIHSQFQMPADEMTRRICRALEHPCADILGHVSGRLLLSREAYAFDLEAVLDTAARCRTIIEINGDPHRLDLDWRYCRAARERGIRFAVNPDAHSGAGLANIVYGLNVARKGWLTKDDVVNCLGAAELRKLIRANREHRRQLGTAGA